MSGRELHERASALFLELRALAEPARRERLAALESDQELWREVASLLGHDVEEEGPATDGAPAGGGTPVGEIDGLTMIGDYRIITRLGRGGSGYVLLGEQEHPVRRRVAIKIVPQAAFDPVLASRFEFERRALERTEHPNITKILDAGRTAGGLPYLVMEYVDGAPITEYCRERGVGLRGRIGFVIAVADAVQHAHQRGVIHRDLKPGNILVAEVDGKPLPRVLDFGIAKLDGGVGGPGVTLGLPVGTPAYMAPEQIVGADVDTRADVYALGAVLYELVSGRAPIDATGDALEVLRRVRDERPMPASRVRIAGGREAAPRWMMADLDCILDKALEKDPARRYSTVAALAEDLGRLLRREPIEARPATLGYRGARFVQRHRVMVSAAGAVAVAAVVAICGLGAGLVIAERQRAEAERQTESQRAINRFLTDDLLAAASPDEAGENITALELLARAGRGVDARFANRPLVAASIHHTLGSSYSRLGAFDDAARHLERALELRQVHAGRDAADTVRTEIAMGALLAARQRLAEAEEMLERSISRARMVLGADDPALYTALSELGAVYELVDRGPEAVHVLAEALAGRIRLLGEQDPRVLTTTSNLAQAYDRLGDTERSLELLLGALRIAEGAAEPARMVLIELNNNIGATYQDLRRNEEAAPFLRRAAALAEDWLGQEHPDTLTIQANLAGLEARLGDPARATALYDAVIGVRLRTLGPDSFDTLTARYGRCNSLWLAGRAADAAAEYAVLLADLQRVFGEDHWLTLQTRSSMGLALRHTGALEEALVHLRRASEGLVALYGPEHHRAAAAAALLAEVERELGAGAGDEGPPPG